MTCTEPPSLATWLLEHWTPGNRNEALAGDLQEEFRSGRSAGWYWRQVVAAIVIGYTREIFNRRVLLVFAVLWSMLAPAWMHYAFRFEAHGNFIGYIWRIDWPWSTICDLSLNLMINLSFVWVGMLLYLPLQAVVSGGLDLGRIGRAVLRSVAVFIAASAIILFLAVFLPPGHPVDQRTITLLGVITDVRLWSLVVRLPFLLAILVGLWRIASAPNSRRKQIIA